MSTFSTGITNVNLNTLKNEALTWTDTSNVTLGEASNHYHGATNAMNWFYNKTFRSIRLYNEWNDTAGTNPPSNPSVSLTAPFSLTSGTNDGASITPKTLSHNDYTVTISATTPYGWVWNGWYTAPNGTGSLITSIQTVTLGFSSYTSTQNWYAYHATIGQGGPGGPGNPGFQCLDGDSEVLMADGQYKKVRDIHAGELLASGTVGDKPNTGYENDMEAYMNWNDHIASPEIQISSSMVDSNTAVNRQQLKVINGGLLKMSLDHPVLVRKPLIDGTTAWTVRGAFNIEVGDILLHANGQQIEVETVEVLEGDFEVYDLRVIGNDTISVNDTITIVNI